MTTNLWLTVAVWTTVYLLDFSLTMRAARLFRGGADRHLGFGGSLELTPMFQRDVDQLRRVSPRFIFFLILSNALLIVLWFLAVGVLSRPGLFAFAAGIVILREAPVLMRHARNLSLFRSAQQAGALAGRLDYARWLVLRQSALELLGFALLFLFVFALAGDWFWLGGAVGCAVLAQNHWRLARRARLTESAETPPSPPAPGR